MSNDRALGMLATALEMERTGHQFYRETLKQCENPTASEIFRMLMEDEVVHVDIIKRIYDAMSGGRDWSGDLGRLERDRTAEDLGGFFRELARAHPDPKQACHDDLQALEMGLDFERRAVRFYEDHLATATDPLERRFVERMLAEERSHVAVLLDMKIYLETPDQWLEQTGNPLLDGA
jgi:rubrerythrin